MDEEKRPIISRRRIDAIEEIAATNWLSVREDRKSPSAIRALDRQETPMKFEISSAPLSFPKRDTGIKFTKEMAKVISNSKNAARNLPITIPKRDTGEVKRSWSVRA